MGKARTRAWYRIQAQADADVADIYLYDIIGVSYWGEDTVSAKQFLEDLKALPASIRTLRLHVNSPGGDPFDATAMHNLLRDQAQEKGRTVEVLIEGLAASAATIVACAGDTVKIARNALFMIHNPWTFAIGDADEMLRMAASLETIEDSIVASYRRLSPLSAEEIKALMDAGTWMDAEEAVAKGFCTETIEPTQMAATFDLRALKTLGNVPERFRARVAGLIRVAAQEEDEEDWRVGGARDLAMDEERSWDAAEAEARIRRWASEDGSGDNEQMDWPKYRKAFVVYDAANAEDFAGYKLGFADIVDDELAAIKAGLVAVRSVLEGGRGGVDLPEDVIEEAKAFVDSYFDEEEEEEGQAAAAVEVLAAVEEAGLQTGMARELIQAAVPMAEVRKRIAAAVEARQAAENRAKEIRRLCALAKCPELAEGYSRGGMSVADVKTQLTIVTAKLDKAEIDGHLSPGAGGPKVQINPAQIYAERNRLTPKEA